MNYWYTKTIMDAVYVEGVLGFPQKKKSWAISIQKESQQPVKYVADAPNYSFSAAAFLHSRVHLSPLQPSHYKHCLH